jgi:hypothetical protein
MGVRTSAKNMTASLGTLRGMLYSTGGCSAMTCSSRHMAMYVDAWVGR